MLELQKRTVKRLPFFCDPVGARTQDLQLRRLLLYPTELRNQYCFGGQKYDFFPSSQIFYPTTLKNSLATILLELFFSIVWGGRGLPRGLWVLSGVWVFWGFIALRWWLVVGKKNFAESTFFSTFALIWRGVARWGRVEVCKLAEKSAQISRKPPMQRGTIG